MKERPILFSAPMVEAILEGKKTVTRRIVKLREFQRSGTQGYDWTFRDRRGLWNDLREDDIDSFCPYGQRGDRLWVRESWAHDAENLEAAKSQHEDAMSPSPVYYLATLDKFLKGTLRKRPSIHMPRWASRINLEVTGVRVERLQDITPEQAKAEGDNERSGMPEYYERGALCHVDWYKGLWRDINGLGSWELNPWVWVVEFQVLTPVSQ